MTIPQHNGRNGLPLESETYVRRVSKIRRDWQRDLALSVSVIALVVMLLLWWLS